MSSPPKYEMNDPEGYGKDGNYIGNKGPWFGTRYTQILLVTYCLLFGFATRGSFAVQIVAMTAKNSSSSNPNIPIYSDWDSNILLSAFYWLYVVSNLFAGPIDTKFGPKKMLLGAMFLNCIAYTAIPQFAVWLGETGVLICRLVQGLGEGFMLPTQQMLVGLWAPSQERSRSAIVVATGQTIGSMLGSMIPGLFAPTWWGWPASYYTLGGIGFVWCALYFFFGHSSPATHPRITPEEKRYIQLSLNQHTNAKVPIPFKCILTSIHFWAVLSGQIGIAWTNNMALTEYSAFLDKVMHFSIQSNGLYSAIPPAMALLASLALFGPISDYVITNQYLSTVNTRRIIHLAGAGGIIISIMTMSYLEESQKAMSIFLMATINISSSAMNCGSIINMIDLSPRFAGLIFGISNASGQLIALNVPLLVHFVVKDETDITQWRIVFIITAAITLGSALIFAAFASGDRQPWDGPEPNKPMVAKQKKLSVISISGDGIMTNM